MSSIFLKISFDNLRKVGAFGRIPSVIEFELAVTKLIHLLGSATAEHYEVHGYFSYWSILPEYLPTTDIYRNHYRPLATAAQANGTHNAFVDAIIEMTLPQSFEKYAKTINGQTYLTSSAIIIAIFKKEISADSLFKVNRMRSCYYVTEQRNGAFELVPHAFSFEAVEAANLLEQQKSAKAMLFISSTLLLALVGMLTYMLNSEFQNGRYSKETATIVAGTFLGLGFLSATSFGALIEKQTDLAQVKQQQPLPLHHENDWHRFPLFRRPNGAATIKNDPDTTPLTTFLPPPMLP